MILRVTAFQGIAHVQLKLTSKALKLAAYLLSQYKTRFRALSLARILLMCSVEGFFAEVLAEFLLFALAT